MNSMSERRKAARTIVRVMRSLRALPRVVRRKYLPSGARNWLEAGEVEPPGASRGDRRSLSEGALVPVKSWSAAIVLAYFLRNGTVDGLSPRMRFGIVCK